MRNPLEFYYKVLKIKEKTPWNLPSIIWTKEILHMRLSSNSIPYQDQILTPADFKQMKERLTPLMEERYQSIYHGTQHRTGGTTSFLKY